MPTCKRTCGREYNKRITFQIQSTTEDAFGDFQPGNWVDSVKTYGKIETGGGLEVYRARQTNDQVTAVVEVPFNSSTSRIDAAGRFVINCKYYEILYVQNVDENNEVLKFGCRGEGQA